MRSNGQAADMIRPVVEEYIGIAVTSGCARFVLDVIENPVFVEFSGHNDPAVDLVLAHGRQQ